LGQKINLSGISLPKCSQSGPNSVYMDISRGDNVQGILGTIGPFWKKMGAGTNPVEAVFCVVIQRTFWQLRNSWFSPNLVMKCSSVSRCGIRKDIFETFHFRGHLPPKSEVKKGSNKYLTQNSLQVRGCTAERYCLLCIVVQWPGSFQGMVNFSLWHTVVELGASKLPNFRILACFPHTNP